MFTFHNMCDENEENLDFGTANQLPDSRLMKWPLFHLLSAKIASTICMAMVFGKDGDEAVFVTKDDMVCAFGTNQDGCLGLGHQRSVFFPEQVTDLCSKKIQFFAHSIGPNIFALTEDGKIKIPEDTVTWLMLPDFYRATSFAPIINDGCMIQCDPLNSDNFFTVYSWGKWAPANSENYMIPYRILTDLHVVSIACGSRTCVALTNKGMVYTWEGKSLEHSQPRSHSLEQYTGGSQKLVDLPKNAVYIACGYSFNMAITKDGLVYGWGCNDSGQLGVQHAGKTIVNPVRIEGLQEFISKVACGSQHTLALSTSGTVYGWGMNTYGQLGCKPELKSCISAPTKIPNLLGIKDIAAMYCSNISVALTDANEVYIWGQCKGQKVPVPIIVSSDCIHDAFSCFATPTIMHQPLICEEGHDSQIIHRLKEAFNDPTTSDLTIIVNGDPIYVHKTLLKIRSPYFRKMFQKCWVENNKSEMKEDMFSYEVYKAYLKYLYTDKLELSAEGALDLLVLADMHGDLSLKTKSLLYIRNNITEHNAIYLYTQAIENNFKDLQKACFAFALRHMTAVVKSKHFREMSHDAMITFIVEAAEADAFIT